MSAKSTILFVDDEPIVLDALKRVFQDHGYELLFANSGHEAITILEQRKVHLVVSDYRMPKMDGCQLLQVVSERWPEIIRIILSGYADIQAVVSAINEGQIYKYVSKPWSNAELTDIVVAGIEKHWQVAELRSLAEVAAAQSDKLVSDHIKSIERLSRRHFDIEKQADLAEAYQIAFRAVDSPMFIFREGIVLDANSAARDLLNEFDSVFQCLADHPLLKELSSHLAGLKASAIFDNVTVPLHLASGLVVKVDILAQSDSALRLNIVAKIRTTT